ncbi:MAG: hypothetical protein JWM59_735 [Verrucomicrobiales bacterium]|nr:hypothetical protein [Verrucomicrobiales bacterium]
MAQFIHLTDKHRLGMIRRNGITARPVFGRGKGVFATPVTRNFLLFYQWLRELRRSGIQTVYAVQFRLDDEAEVVIGRYNGERVTTTAADAVRLFMEHKT